MARRESSRPDGARRRRRASAEDPLQKVTLQLPMSLAEAIRTLVRDGEVPSANVFVEEAVRTRLRERRRSLVYGAYAEAARDPEFMADMGDATAAGERVDDDGLDGE